MGEIPLSSEILETFAALWCRFWISKLLCSVQKNDNMKTKYIYLAIIKRELNKYYFLSVYLNGIQSGCPDTRKVKKSSFRIQKI